MPKGEPKFSLKPGSEIVLVVCEDDRIEMENETYLNIRVEVIPKSKPLRRGIIGKSGVLFILAANLCGDQQQELIKRAVRRCYAIFIAHTHDEFYEVFQANLMHALRNTNQLVINFNPEKKNIRLQHGFVQFAPSDLTGQGRANAYGNRNGRPDSERSLGYLMEELVALDDYDLPSLLIVEKYRKRINESFDLGNDVTMAAAWRARRGIVLPVRRNLAMYELVLFLMRQKGIAARDQHEVAEILYDEVHRFYPKRKNKTSFLSSLATCVGYVYLHNSDLRMKIAA